jgi:hypothetical protein
MTRGLTPKSRAKCLSFAMNRRPPKLRFTKGMAAFARRLERAADNKEYPQ